MRKLLNNLVRHSTIRSASPISFRKLGIHMHMSLKN